MTDVEDADHVIFDDKDDPVFPRTFSINPKTHPEALAVAIREALLKLAYPIGILRLISIQHDLGLKFKSIDHNKVLSSGKLVVDVSSLVKTVLAAGAKSGVTAATLNSELIRLAKNNYDPWQICQGHDLNKLFVLAVRKYWGIGKLSVEEIERNMRLAYEAEFFWETELGKELLLRFAAMERRSRQILNQDA